MTQETLEQAIQLNDFLENARQIAEAMEKEDNHWWGFITPDTKRWDEGGIRLSFRLRDKFEQTVKETIAEIEKEIEEL